MTNAKQALLSKNRKALQFLNKSDGFDFQQDHIIIKQSGKFTFNTVTKLVKENIIGEYKAALLLPRSSGRLNYVDVGRHKFKPLRKGGVKYWDYEMNYYFGIGDFEGARKSNTGCYYIVAQSSALLKKKTESESVDLKQRFHYIPDGDRKGSNGCGKTWISEIKLRMLNNNGRIFEYKPSPFWSHDNNLHERVDQIVDKSGYIILERRRELIQAARLLRAERKKADAAKADFTKRETDIKSSIKEVKRQLSNALIESIDYEAVKIVENSLYSLLQAMRGFESHLRRVRNSTYNKVEEIEDKLNSVEQYLKNATEIVKGV